MKASMERELSGFFLKFRLAWRVLTSRSVIVICQQDDKQNKQKTVLVMDCRCRDKVLSDLYDRLCSFIPHWSAQRNSKKKKEDEAD